jgi:hypothetical protein
MMRRRKLNVVRKTGRFEFQQVTGRYSNGAPNGSIVLWVGAGRTTRLGGGRFVACATFDPTEQRGFLKGVWGGPGCCPNHKPVAVAHSERCAR